jgi:pyridoxamine 5'-phosphate oxidase
MTKQEIFDFISKNPICALATVEGDQPRVRMILMYRADENGIVFVTGENKDLYKQLSKTPNVEMCFYSQKENKQARISGVAEELEDIELKKQVVRDWPFLKEWIDREGYDVLVMYCLKNGKTTVWTMDVNFKPKEYIQL